MVKRGRDAFTKVEALMSADSAFAEEVTRRGDTGIPLVLLDWPEAPAPFREMVEVDRANARRFSEIVQRSGWPGINLVGADGEEAAWEIAMHSDTAQPDRLTWLPLVEEASRSGDVPLQHVEFLRLRSHAVEALAPPAE